MNEDSKFLDFENYQEWIKEKIRENASVYGYKTQLASAAGCQKSFFSQVLAERAHLTPEHGLGLANFWALSPRYTEYFLDLLNVSRAGTPVLKAFYQERLRSFQKEQKDISHLLSDSDIGNAKHEAIYYSSWLFSALHIALTIPRLQNADALSRYLEISPSLAQSTLKQLERMGLVHRIGKGCWEPTKKHLHLSKASPFNLPNLLSWRSKALESAVAGGEDGIHYSSTYSLSRKDLALVRREILKLIENIRRTVEPSNSEVLAAINLDFFHWG